MVCPYCSGVTEVVNSRNQKRNNQVWRRRRCQSCKTVFTTHETVYLPQLFIVRHGQQTAVFEPAIITQELMILLRHRQRASEDAHELAAQIIQKVIKNSSKGLILAQDISLEAAKVLKSFDTQAYLRFVAEHPSIHNQVTSAGRQRGRSL